MKNKCLRLSLLCLIILSCGKKNKSIPVDDKLQLKKTTTCKDLDGKIYEFSNDPDTNLLFSLKFKCQNDTLMGIMLGPYATGESIKFFKAEINQVRIENENVDFTAISSNLFEQPFTLNNYDKKFKADTSGWGDFNFKYSGKIHGDTITLACLAPDYGNFNYCYTDTMLFIVKNK